VRLGPERRRGPNALLSGWQLHERYGQVMSRDPSRLGRLAGLGVVVVALVIGVLTTSAAWLLILEWALLVALIGWLVFAIVEKRRPRRRDT